MNTSFERSANASDEWYTPREIIEALGEFDLDPCAPMHPLWPTAKIMYNKQDNGLIQNWGGANLAYPSVLQTAYMAVCREIGRTRQRDSTTF